MRNIRKVDSRQRVVSACDLSLQVLQSHPPSPPARARPIGRVWRALERISDMLSKGIAAHPERLRHDITAYALALLQLRESSAMAGMERLTNACDALAITVSRLIDDGSRATQAQCEALTRFAAHARAMIAMYGSQAMLFKAPDRALLASRRLEAGNGNRPQKSSQSSRKVSRSPEAVTATSHSAPSRVSTSTGNRRMRPFRSPAFTSTSSHWRLSAAYSRRS